MAQVAACDNHSLYSDPTVSGDRRAKLSAFIQRNMRERDGRDCEIAERPLQKRQLHFNAVFFGVSGGLAHEECHLRFEMRIKGFIDGDFTQRRTPGFPRTQRRAMAEGAVINADQNYALNRWIEAGIEMGCAGARVSWPSVGHHAGD